MGITHFPGGVLAPNIQSNDAFASLGNAVFYVDGDSGNDGNDGTAPDAAKLTIQSAVTAAAAANAEYKGGSTVYIKAKDITDYTGDPSSYAETIIIPFAGGNRMRLVGCGTGRTQGGLPQIKIGSGTTAMLTIRAPGCSIENIGFNGASSTGGGILLDDDYAAKAAFGTSIVNCHFKNCIVTDTSDGGAIYTTTAGNCWQVLISGCKFYKNASDIALIGTSNTVPQDWVIENCIFSGPAASVDCQVNLKGAGSGINGVTVNNCVFPVLGTLSAGTVKRMIDMTGCVGSLTNCVFGCITAEAETDLTFGATGTGGLVATTVFMANNWGQSGATAAAADGAAGEIFRT